MGHIKHDAIIFTTWDKTKARKLHAEARRLFGTKQVTAPAQTPVNGFTSFVIMPHGSKDGWQEKAHWDRCKKMLFEFINDNFLDEDREHCFDWVHVNFGGDDWDVSAQTKNLKVTGEI